MTEPRDSLSLTALMAHVRLVLDRFDLAVDLTTHRQVTGIFGASGSGKTSLLETIAGLRREAKGTIRLGDYVWTKKGKK